jgi:hypothetical protein
MRNPNPPQDRGRTDEEDDLMVEKSELNRVAALADQLAERMLTELETRMLTTEEFETRQEVALIAKVAAMLQDVGLELPPGIRRLGRKAAEQAQV